MPPCRDEPPMPSRFRPYLPITELATIQGGIPIFLVEQPIIPLVHIEIVLRHGSTSDPEGLAGIAMITTEMLTRGTERLGEAEIDAAFYDLGAEYSARCSWESTRLSISVPLCNAPEAIRLLRSIALRPTFPLAKLEQAKASRLARIQARASNPNALANALTDRSLYPEHPYGTPVMGVESAIRQITNLDLQHFHALNFVPTQVALVIVGAARSVRPALQQAFGEWIGTDPNPSVVTFPREAEGMAVLVDRPGARHSVIRVGFRATPRKSPEFPALLVLNTILGGYTSSRLRTNLRDRHGYTYAIPSRLALHSAAGAVVITSSVQTDISGRAIGQILDEVERLRAEQVQPDELDLAKNYAVFSHASKFLTSSYVAEKVGDTFVYGLPPELHCYIDDIFRVSSKDITELAGQYLRPENAVWVVVGDIKSMPDEALLILHDVPVTTLTIEEAYGQTFRPDR